eukprot:scaffold2881_cov45-Attheya_sp.AAC.1
MAKDMRRQWCDMWVYSWLYPPSSRPCAAPLQITRSAINCIQNDNATLAKVSIRVGSSACSVAFSPDGGLLASGCQDRRVRIWNCSNGRYITLAGHTSFINSVKFSIDRNILASASSDRTIRLWRLADHSCQFLEGHEEEVRDIAFSPDGAYLASGDNNGFVRLWDLNYGRCIRTLRDERLGMIYSVAFSPDRRTIASAGQNGGDGTGTISFWVLSDHAFTSHIATAIIDDIDNDGMVRTISFSPDGWYLASVDNDAEAPVRLWNVTDHSCVGSLQGHDFPAFTSISFSPNGKLLVSASTDSSIQLWSVENKTCLLVLPNRHIVKIGGFSSVTFTPDGRTLATGCGDVVRLWNPHEERQRDKQFDWKEIVRLWKS